MIGSDAVRGHIDLIVLSILERQESYAYEISRTMGEHAPGGFSIKQTTLYTALKRLESAGLLSSSERTAESGKQRTYYRVTAEGLTQLERMRAEWEQTRALIDHFAVGQEKP